MLKDKQRAMFIQVYYVRTPFKRTLKPERTEFLAKPLQFHLLRLFPSFYCFWLDGSCCSGTRVFGDLFPVPAPRSWRSLRCLGTLVLWVSLLLRLPALGGLFAVPAPWSCGSLLRSGTLAQPVSLQFRHLGCDGLLRSPHLGQESYSWRLSQLPPHFSPFLPVISWLAPCQVSLIM